MRVRWTGWSAGSSTRRAVTRPYFTALLVDHEAGSGGRGRAAADEDRRDSAVLRQVEAHRGAGVQPEIDAVVGALAVGVEGDPVAVLAHAIHRARHQVDLPVGRGDRAREAGGHAGRGAAQVPDAVLAQPDV